MINIRHDNHGDTLFLSSMVRMVPIELHTKFAANIIGNDLMRGPWWMRAMIWTVGKLRGWSKTATWFLFLKEYGRGMSTGVVDAFVLHINHGKDRSDLKSVGGLNQEEIRTTEDMLRCLLKDVDVSPLCRSVLWPESEHDGK